MGIHHAYLFWEVVQLLPSIVDELVYVDDLLAVNGSCLEFSHQRRNIPNLLV
jgi:hypothetical protein